MNILLHVCCAPCSIYPITRLKESSHKFAGYYYNPNVHPFSEYLKRKCEADKYFKTMGLNLLAGHYDMERYFQYTVHNEEKALRCPVCWWMRLESAAKAAKDNGFDAFTTTLLGSPYQDHDILKSVGEDIAGKCSVKFYYEDFRPGFRGSIAAAKAQKIYCQNYCGCIYSEKEMIEAKSSMHRKRSGAV